MGGRYKRNGRNCAYLTPEYPDRARFEIIGSCKNQILLLLFQ